MILQPVPNYEFPYFRYLETIHGEDDEWTNDPTKMDLYSLYFQLSRRSCLATKHGIEGLGPMLVQVSGTESMYVLRDKNGYFYVIDVEENTPLVEFSRRLTEDELIHEIWDADIRVGLMSGKYVCADHPSAPHKHHKEEKGLEASIHAIHEHQKPTRVVAIKTRVQPSLVRASADDIEKETVPEKEKGQWELSPAGAQLLREVGETLSKHISH